MEEAAAAEGLALLSRVLRAGVGALQPQMPSRTRVEGEAMSDYGKNHPTHCACVVTLRRIAESLIDAIDQPPTVTFSAHAAILAAAVEDAKARLSDVRGGRDV